jgi:amidase
MRARPYTVLAVDATEIAFAGVRQQAELVRSGEVSSRELVELCLERIERLNPELNCFTNLMGERALADAGQADARRGAGDERPLLGVPLAVKDTEDVAGEVTSWGTAAYTEPARADGELVRRLRSAGAVIVGKTNLPELAIIADTENSTFGITRNPWDTDRSAGGSSGGSGAAVAAGLVPAATASDGMGSIRIPAANCGLVGLKPQRDRIPLTPLGEHWLGLSVVGFEARRVADAALLMDVATEGAHGYAAAAASAPAALRIGVSVKPPVPVPVHADVKRAVEDAAGALRSLGHETAEANPDYGVTNPAAVRWFAGVAEDVARAPMPERLQRRTRGWGRAGRAIAPPVLRWARQEDHWGRMRPLFERFDVLLIPTCAQPPVRAGQWEGRGWIASALGNALTYAAFAAEWNLTGQPAISVPGSPGDDGLPIGVQLVGRPDGEPTLLALAAQLEAELRWADRRPTVS